MLSFLLFLQFQMIRFPLNLLFFNFIFQFTFIQNVIYKLKLCIYFLIYFPKFTKTDLRYYLLQGFTIMFISFILNCLANLINYMILITSFIDFIKKND